MGATAVRAAARRRSTRPGVLVLIATLALVAVAATGWAEAIDVGETRASSAVLVPFAFLLAAAEYLLIRFRYRGQVNALNLFEAALAPLLFAYPPVQVVAVVVAAQVVAALVRRNVLVKAAFNVTQWAAAAAAGSLVLAALDVGREATGVAVAGLVLALGVVGLVNQTAFTVVLSLVDPQPLRRVLAGLAPVIHPGWTVGWAFNTLVGLLFVLAFESSELAVALFVVPLFVLHAAYRGYAGAKSDRARLAGLHRASQLLADPPEPDRPMAAYLAEVCSCFEAQAAELVLRRDGTLVVHTVQGGDPTTYREMVEPAGDNVFRSAVIDHGGTVRVTSVGSDHLAELLAVTDWQDCLAAPLRSGDAPGGALLVFDQAGLEGFEEGERAVLEALARETAGIFDMLRLAEREAAQREVVHWLEESVRPPVPAVPGAELAVHYLPSDSSAPTGGDLYDWQVLPDGELHLAVVDVLGAGVSATKDALTVVHALRLLALEKHPLESVVARADELVRAQNPELVATVLVGRYCPRSGRLRLAGGGHPPPFFLSGSGEVTEVPAPGGAIGWPGAGTFETADLELDHGETVVIYTDGLVEARKDIIQGMEALARTAAEIHDHPVEHLARALVERSLAGAARRDDTLALVLRREPAHAGADGPFHHDVDDFGDLSAARRALRSWLDRQAVTPAQVEDLTLVASELLTNGVRAARHRTWMRAWMEPDAVVLEVHDDGTGLDPSRPVPTVPPAPEGEAGRGLFLVNALVDDLVVFGDFGGSVVRCRARRRARDGAGSARSDAVHSFRR